MTLVKDLERLIKELVRLADQADLKAKRQSKNAGHSLDESGTGDEGWSELFELSGKSSGLRVAAYKVETLLKKHEKK